MQKSGKKKRTYNTRLIKRDYSYLVEEICELYGIRKHTVFQWVKAGLPTTDDKKPFLIHGSELQTFLKERQEKRKNKCKDDELYCPRCRQPRKPWEGAVDVQLRSARKINLVAVCSTCGAGINKAISAAILSEIEKIFKIQKVLKESLLVTLPPSLNHHIQEIKDEKEVQPTK